MFTFDRFKPSWRQEPYRRKHQGDLQGRGSRRPEGALQLRGKPNAAMLGTLAMPYAGIISPTAVKAAGDYWGTKPVGTGPFKLGEWKRASASPSNGTPTTTGVRPRPEQGAGPHRQAGLQADPGRQHAAPGAPGRRGGRHIHKRAQPLAPLWRRTRISSSSRSTWSRLIYLGYNCAKAPFDEIPVGKPFPTP